MAEPAKALPGTFTYREYRTWPDGERWELIDGVAWNMSPAPLLTHQDSAAALGTEIRNFLKIKPCKIFYAPVDVLFPRPGESDEESDTVVQPDIVVVCDPAKTENGKYIRGAPDLVVEILSPSTSRKDMNEKYRLYEREGVREYWIIEPRACWLHRYVLGEDGRYGEALVREKSDGFGAAASAVLSGFSFDPDSIFSEV